MYEYEEENKKISEIRKLANANLILLKASLVPMYITKIVIGSLGALFFVSLIWAILTLLSGYGEIGRPLFIILVSMFVCPGSLVLLFSDLLPFDERTFFRVRQYEKLIEICDTMDLESAKKLIIRSTSVKFDEFCLELDSIAKARLRRGAEVKSGKLRLF